jgi:hypothetical protein
MFADFSPVLRCSKAKYRLRMNLVTCSSVKARTCTMSAPAIGAVW